MQVHFTPESRARVFEFFGSRDGRVALAAIASAFMLFGLALGAAMGLALIGLGIPIACACVFNARVFGATGRGINER
jgi:hypothetical protein